MKLKTLLYSLGIGAGLLYYYDPNQGNRRRALLRDQVNKSLNRTDRAIDIATRDLRNRSRGMVAEVMGRLSEDNSPDWLLEERVRSSLGRQLRRAGDVQLSSKGGVLTLTGKVLSTEAERLMKAAAAVRGIHSVDNQMQVVDDPAQIPSLQNREMENEYSPDGWSPALRLISSVGGGALAMYGGFRRGIVGTALSAAGLGLLARGVTNTNLRDLMGMSGTRRAIDVQKAINLNVPVEEIYNFWSNFENLPRFMQHVKEVRDLGNGRSHWVVTGPGGMDVEWDAIVTNMLPNQLISWESVAGSPVKTAGMVRFDPNPNGGTRVTVQMGYTPPAGALGHAVASLMGVNPKQQMDDDLARLKGLFDHGQTHVEGRRLTPEDALSGSTTTSGAVGY